MNVIVDTPIWSLALRRRKEKLSTREGVHVQAWECLVREDRVILMGVVRQEVLCGVKDAAVFERLAALLHAFPDEPLSIDDYEQAAKCCNVCAASGVSGSYTDFLLCAVAMRRGCEIFTLDADFVRYAKHLPIRLHAAGSKDE